MKLQVLGSLTLCTSSVLADGYKYFSDEELTVIGCKGAVYSTATYCNKDSTKKYVCDCKNKPALGSWLYCIYDQVGQNNTKAEKVVEEYCAAEDVEGLTSAKLRAAYENATEYIVDPTTIGGFNKSKIFDAPVYYNKKKYHNYYESNKVRRRNESDAMFMGAGLLGYWAFIFLVATIYNFVNRVAFINKSFKSSTVNKIRSSISLPSLFANKKHSNPIQFAKVFGGYLPTRIETIVLFVHFALLFIFTGVRYHYVKNDTIWLTEDGQRGRYPGDRTGILALYSFQLTFLFAGRNNFLIWLTGWKQSTFYTYHKWISRFNFILILIHAGSMHKNSVGIGYEKFVARIHTYWYRWGIIAVTCAGVLVFTAAYQVRKSYYEVFLLTHIVIAAIFLAATWIHAENFGYQQFTIALAAIWCFDRFVRIARLVSFGAKNAKVSVVSDEILKVVVPRSSLFNAFPGSYGYLHYLTSTTFFQSHPFTVIQTSETEITFVTKIKGGVTSQIHGYLRKQPGLTGTIKISVEGPYGTPSNVQRYDTALLYSGGTGIAGPFSHALKSVKSGVQQHIKLYWVIRHWHSVDWFYEELLKLKDTSVNVIVYVTQPDSALGERFAGLNSSSDSTDEEIKSEREITAGEKEQVTEAHSVITKKLDFVEFRYGRPSIAELIHDDFEESNGTVGVWTAGHGAMVDDIRSAVGEYLNVAKGRVDYFEELQVW